MPASASPVIWGLLSVDGEGGSMLVIWGTAGGLESSTYWSAAEHAEMLPAPSMAVARNEVVVLSATVVKNPG